MLTSAEIADLEERRQAAMLAAVTPLVRPFAGGVMGFHEPGSWQNQACGVGLDGPVDEAEIDAMVTFYRSRGVEPRVELSPFADASLIAGLAARGFVVREFEQVLARELPADEDLEAQMPRISGLTIEIVDEKDDAIVACSVAITLSGFYPPGEAPQVMIDACRNTLLLPSVSALLARIDGEPASSGQVSCGERVASLMGVSTLERFRRRGLQQALMARRLQLARERGCELATIGSRPGLATERNAMSLGFRVAYTKAILVQPGPDLLPSP